MFTWDSKEHMLCVHKVPYAKVENVYPESDMYRSYMRFVKYSVKDIIRNELVAELGSILEDACSVGIETGDISVFLDVNSSFRGYEYYSVRLVLKSLWLNDGIQPFVVFKVPVMSKAGVITRENKQYAVISEIVQADDLTYNDGELKLVTASGCFVNMKSTSSTSGNIKTKFGSTSLNTVEVFACMAKEEGLDSEKMFSKLRSVEFSGMFKDQLQRSIVLYYGSEGDTVKQYVNNLKREKYRLYGVRDRLNKMVSLDRALGERLVDRVILKDGSCIPGGTYIDDMILQKIKANCVNEVYVEYVPNMVGQYVASPIIMDGLRKGTQIVDCIADVVPGQKGYFIDRDILFEKGNPIIIPENTIVTKGMLEMLVYNGYKSVRLKTSATSSVSREVPLSVSVIGNRHFCKRDVGLGDADDYVFIDEEGNVSEPKDYLTSYDMLAMLSLFDRLKKGFDKDVIADMDLGFRKKVNQADELFSKALSKVIKAYVGKIKRKFINTFRDRRTDFGRADVMEEMFYGLSKDWWRCLREDLRVIQPVDKTNPIAFVSSLSKINTVVKNKEAVKRSQHSLSLGHFNRICPFETPVGQTMGLVGNKAKCSSIVDGQIMTPYYKVEHRDGKHFLEEEETLLGIQEEENYRIGCLTDLEVDWGTREVIGAGGRVLARVPSMDSIEKLTVAYINLEYLDYVNVDPQQVDSLAVTTMPFQGANDAVRVSFGVSQVKQAKCPVNAKAPLVVTSGFKDIVWNNDYFLIHAEYDGTVEVAENDHVVVVYDNGELGDYTYKSKEFYTNTLIVRKLMVKEGQRVNAGSILVESNFTDNGWLAVGKDALVAFGEVGYNYEDGVYMSERFACDIMTYGCTRQKNKVPRGTQQCRITGIDKFMYKKKGDTLCDVSYMGDNGTTKSNIIAEHVKGFVISSGTVTDSLDIDRRMIETVAVSLDFKQRGDKSVNRHGNKGVIAKTAPNREMPCFRNGEYVDIVYNAGGIPTRMNLGQVLECHLGFVAYILSLRIRSDSYNGADIEEIRLLLSYVWDLANKDDWDAVMNDFKYSALPKEMHEHCRNHRQRIVAWRGSFNPDGTAWMINPRTGKYFEQPLVVGINYVEQLYHEAFKKEHSRSGLCCEPYLEKQACAPKGSSNNGGQRMGYMELDALMAYGASGLLQEDLNERGDNPVARNNLTVKHLHETDEYLLDEKTAVRRSTEEFQSMMQALGVTIEFEGLLPDKTICEYMNRQVYRPRVLKCARLNMGNHDTGAKMSARRASRELDDMI